MVALSYRYLPIFPQEQELNPLDPAPVVDDADETEAAPEEQAEAAEGEPEPAQA